MDDEVRALSTGSTTSEKHGILRWYYDSRSVILIATIIAISITLPTWRLLNNQFEWMHPAVAAIIGGICTTIMAYPVCAWADSTFGLSTAVLLGLVSASFVVYGAPIQGEVTSPLIIAFFCFHVFFGYSEAALLDPPLYRQWVNGTSYAKPEKNIAPIDKLLEKEEINEYNKQKHLLKKL